VQGLDDFIVFGVILKPTSRIDGTCDAKAVEFSHEVTGGVLLLVRWQFRSLRQRGIEDHGIRPGDQQTGRIAPSVALDFTTGRFWRVLGVPDCPKGCPVEQRPVVQV